MLRLVRFREFYERHGELKSLFVVNQKQWDTLLLLKKHGFVFRFDEAFGGSSYVTFKLTDYNLHMVTDDQDFLKKLVEIIGWHLSGVDLINDESITEFLEELSEKRNDDES
jgi:hypothetical protein